MRKSIGLMIGAAMALTALGGCGERDSGKHSAKTEKQGVAAARSSLARLGPGWSLVADTRLSVWGFAEKPAPIQGRLLTAQSNAPEPLSGASDQADALAGIRVALMANKLPARASVRIENLVNRTILAANGSDAALSPARPMAVLMTTPWNDDTMLLWIETPSLAEAETISVEFDPKTVAAFRALGDPSALPSFAGASGRTAMLYELAPQPEDTSGNAGATGPNVQYALIHVGARKPDQPITTADVVGAIDNAPEVVRFAAAAAGFGGLLRGDPAVRDLSCNDVIALAQGAAQPDPDGWRARLIALMYRAEPLIDLPPPDSPPRDAK